MALNVQAALDPCINMALKGNALTAITFATGFTTLNTFGMTSLYDLRKAFYNVLVKTGLDDAFKKALMGHKMPGSRGNYFDSHDLDALEKMYLKANFGRHVDKREATILREQLTRLEKANEFYQLMSRPKVRSWLEKKMKEDGLL